MKWYSEEELKKRMGHSITLPLLDKMEYKEVLVCGECPYWQFAAENNTGFCKLSPNSTVTNCSTECSSGFKI